MFIVHKVTEQCLLYTHTLFQQIIAPRRSEHKATPLTVTVWFCPISYNNKKTYLNFKYTYYHHYTVSYNNLYNNQIKTIHWIFKCYLKGHA